MKFYFDTNMAKIDVPAEEMIIYYSSYTHSTLKVDKLAADVFDYITSKKPGQNISYEEVTDAIPELEVNDVKEIFDELSDTHLFFTNLGAYYSNCFISRFQSELSFDPRQVYIHLTYRCNLECEYCYNKEKLNHIAEMELNEWTKVIDDLKVISTPKIYLTGGEPTLYKDFDAIIDYIYKAGLRIELLTNGTTLQYMDKKTLEKIETITVSLDNIGDAKTHRKNSEKYNVLDNILMIHNLGKIVNVRSVVSNDTVKEVRDVKDYLTQYGINHISAIFIPNTLEEIDKVPSEIGFDTFNGNTNLQDIRRCAACFQVLAIDPSGNVYPCQSLMKDEFVLANIKDQDWIMNVRNHNLTKYFLYRTVERIDGCRDCEVKSICSGGCPAIAYNLYHNLEHKLEYACDYLKSESKFHVTRIEF